MKNVEEKKNVIVISLILKMLERCGSQGISFVVGIVLARLLSPEDFGMLAILLIFVNISQTFVQCGLGTALIQRKEIDSTDISSVFYASLAIATVLYFTLFLSAPFIARFYAMPELCLSLRVLAITLFPGALNLIQNALVARHMSYKILLCSSLGAGFFSGVLGITFAYFGLGFWALVSQQLMNQVVICFILWFKVKWRPTMQFSFSKFKTLFSFGWKLLLSNLMGVLYQDLRSLVIGKKFTADMLGFYNRGNQFPHVIIGNINASIQSVMLPALSSQQNNKKLLKSMVRRSIVTSTFVVFPLIMGLALVAEPLVVLLLTEKWLPCVPFLQLMCISYGFWPLHTANLQAINAQGRSDVFLKLEIIKKAVGISVLCYTVLCFDSVMAIVIGEALISPIGIIINAYPNKKLLDYSIKEQITDILPSLVLTCAMGCIVYLVSFLDLGYFVVLCIQVFVGAFTYLLLAWLFKLECYCYLLKTIRQLFYNRK